MARDKKPQRIRAIDGLRALAIIGVLLFHIDESILPGGYLGVDLFFVISGFVVTRSLQKSNIRYPLFLRGRFYRLAPAAAVAIILTMALFAFTGNGLLSKEDEISGLLSLVASSNIYFMFQNSYFDTALLGNPFLHFWSLAVEEQFYLLWPLLLVLVPERAKTARAVALLLMAVLSFWAFTTFPQQAFFLMPARAFQFGLGALAWELSRDRALRLSSYVILVPIAAMLGLFYLMDGTQPWLLGQLIPTLLFALLVWSSAVLPQTGILVLTPTQFLGNISYSLYLVHWPIIVYAHILFPRSIAVDTTVFALSILFGFLLHTLVELPFNVRSKTTDIPHEKRFRRLHNPRALAAPVLSAAAIIITGSALLLQPSSFSHASQQAHRAAASGALTEPVKNTASATLPAEVKGSGVASVIRPAITQSSNVALGSNQAAPVPPSVVTPQSIFHHTTSARDAAITKEWKCATYESGRINGEMNAKLLQDLDLSYCLFGTSMIFADSTSEAAVALLSTIDPEVVPFGQLHTSGCILLVSGSDDDCAKSNEVRLDLIKNKATDYRNIYLAFSWDKYSRDQLAQLVDYAGNSEGMFMFLDQLPRFDEKPEKIMSASGIDADIRPYVSNKSVLASKEISNLAAKYENVNILDWSPVPHPNEPIFAVTSDKMPIYRDEYHNTPEGIDWLIMRHLERTSQ